MTLIKEGTEIMQHDSVLVRKDGGVLQNGTYIGESKATPGVHLVEVEGGVTISCEESQIVPLMPEIRITHGCLLVCNERGNLMLRHMPDAKSENDFMDMWNGKMGLEVISRIDLARNPVVTKQGAGLK